jgi:hypothetical protein
LDAAKFAPQSPVLVAGDLSFDASSALLSGATQRLGFQSEIELPSPHTTPARGLFQRAQSIDCAFLSGPIEAEQGLGHGEDSCFRDFLSEGCRR